MTMFDLAQMAAAEARLREIVARPPSTLAGEACADAAKQSEGRTA